MVGGRQVARRYPGPAMDDGRFDPKGASSFHVTSRTFDATTRTATFSYAFDGGPEFVESVTFETPPSVPVDVEDPRLDRALHHLHVAAGTSYYKTAAPDRVVVDQGVLTPDEVTFHRHLYDEGLREFAVVNHLPVPRPVTVSAAPGHRDAPTRSAKPSAEDERPGRVVVPIGGGKDSLVLAEALRPLAPRLFAVNPHPLVVDLAAQAGLELLVVRRRLSPELDRLNRSGALNGHVPITAIVSLICIAAASVYGYDTIAMAIERSASEETVVVDGVPVNHQYSKSLEFEGLLRRLVASSIDADLRYGSALRPYSELAISRAFAASRPLSGHLLQLQRRLPNLGRFVGRLVRPVRQVSLRGPDAGAVPEPAGAGVDHGDRPARRRRAGGRLRGSHEQRGQALRVRGRAPGVGCRPSPVE